MCYNVPPQYVQNPQRSLACRVTACYLFSLSLTVYPISTPGIITNIGLAPNLIPLNETADIVPPKSSY